MVEQLILLGLVIGLSWLGITLFYKFVIVKLLDTIDAHYKLLIKLEKQREGSKRGKTSRRRITR